MSMFNDISCDGKGNEEECVANSKVVSILAKKFGIGQWSFIGPGSEKKWHSMAVFTEQLQTRVKNLKPIKIDRGNLMY